MSSILFKRHFLANFDKQAIAVTEFQNSRTFCPSTPCRGCASCWWPLHCCWLRPKRSMELRTEGKTEKGHGLCWVSCFYRSFKRPYWIPTVRVYLCILYSCLCGSSCSLRENLISQHHAFGKEDHLAILPNILLFQDPHEDPQKCCIFKASVHTTMFNGWISSWLQHYELQQISACKVGGWWIFWWPVTLGWIIKTTTFRKDHPRKEDFHHQLLHRTFQVLAPLALEVNIYVLYSKLLGAWSVTLVWNL